MLQGVTIQCSLNSRVAILGANGAGKSTMIKLLTGELEPESGIVWKHPNMRVAYVAQHAFHHVEQHLGKTPNEYIQWRCVAGPGELLCLACINAQGHRGLNMCRSMHGATVCTPSTLLCSTVSDQHLHGSFPSPASRP